VCVTLLPVSQLGVVLSGGGDISAGDQGCQQRNDYDDDDGKEVRKRSAMGNGSVL
jgi:hypothetical protein